MSATWKGKSGDIQAVLERLALPNGSTALFNPLPLVLSKGRVKVVSQSQAKTSFIVADLEQAGIESDSEQSATVDVLELLKFLEGFDANAEVTITFGDPVRIDGPTRSCTIHPEALIAPPLNNVPAFVGGIVQFKSGPATTFVTVGSELLQGVVKDAKTIEVPAFPIKTNPTGLSIALGGLEAKKNSITRAIPAEVKGNDVATTIGEDFAYVMGHATGNVQLQLKEKHPLVIVSKGVSYILLPQAVQS